jgi:uncharacterized membrane protein
MALDPAALGRVTSAVPGSIREAAKSPLGFAALGIIAVSLLAYAFFGNSSDTIKMVVFFSVIGCLVFFFVAVAARNDVRPDAQSRAVSNAD